MTENSFSRLVLIGAGKMGRAMLDGWLVKGCGAKTIIVVDPAAPEDLQALAEDGQVTLAADVADLTVKIRDVVILAVKPQVMNDVLASLEGKVSTGALVISVAAGVPLARFEAALGADHSIVRAMPNLPASIGLGITVATANGAASEMDRKRAASLLGAVGEVAWTEDEKDMDAVTALSGSGPAYVFHMIECLTMAGIREGLDPALALKLATETVHGAGVLAATSDLSASTLRENVTSPGGTTAAALGVLMGGSRMEELIGEAVKAAADRSRDLGSTD